jgi:hypothetical protein
MADSFLGLSCADKRDALVVAAALSGRREHLLEKDIWVVWALRALFDSDFAGHLVFKGGTSLSKAYQAIARFSEDVDLTYDIRALVPDLVGDSKDAIPTTRSQQDRWTDAVRERLPLWIQQSVTPALRTRLANDGLEADLVVEADRLVIRYTPTATGTGYVLPAVLLEFGARSTGEPCEPRPVVCDAALHLPDLIFPTATPQVMMAERTFWEKATAIHVFCRGGRFRGPERFSRHWYDVVSLDQAGYAMSALADRDLARAVARHKSMFFREQDANREVINYEEAVSGVLKLVPKGPAIDVLATDYRAMVDDGLMFREAPAFDSLIESCRSIQDRANAATKD